MHAGLLEPAKKLVDRRNAKREMHIACVRRFVANKVQLAVVADFKPNVPVILKRIGNDLSADNVTLKRTALFQIAYIQRDVIKAALHSKAYSRESNILSASGSVTGALQVKFSQT